MKLGGTLTVLGVPYEIQEFADESDSASYGQVHVRKCKIQINRDVPLELQLQTLLHESKHVWQSRHNEDTEDETPCLEFATLMDSLLRENLWLVELYRRVHHAKK